MSKSLCNPSINHGVGWFFATIQVALNKRLFGVTVGETCTLNELGEAVYEVWRSHPAPNLGLAADAFTMTPNRFHAIVHVAGGQGDVR